MMLDGLSMPEESTACRYDVILWKRWFFSHHDYTDWQSLQTVIVWYHGCEGEESRQLRVADVVFERVRQRLECAYLSKSCLLSRSSALILIWSAISVTKLVFRNKNRQCILFYVQYIQYTYVHVNIVIDCVSLVNYPHPMMRDGGMLFVGGWKG